MPHRSDILCYKAKNCLEITLDISDAPDATFQSATFCRGGSEIDWDLVSTRDYERAEFRSQPNLLTLYLKPRLPKGHQDDPNRPVEEILGQLNVKLRYRDAQSGATRHSVTKLEVIPCAVSGCDICESAELIDGKN